MQLKKVTAGFPSSIHCAQEAAVLCSCPFIIVTNDFQVWPSPLQGLKWKLDVSIASVLLQITTGLDVSGHKERNFFTNHMSSSREE